MSPNDVQLIRAWPRKKNSKVGELTLPAGKQFQVVVECEAGSAIGESGMPWWIDICVRDLCAKSPIVQMISHEGAMNWETHLEIFDVPAPTKDRINHVWEIVAGLRVRMKDQDVSFAKSNLFYITEA